MQVVPISPAGELRITLLKLEISNKGVDIGSVV